MNINVFKVYLSVTVHCGTIGKSLCEEGLSKIRRISLPCVIAFITVGGREQRRMAENAQQRGVRGWVYEGGGGGVHRR